MPEPLTDSERVFIDKLQKTEILHWFGRGSNCPPLAYVETEPIVYIPFWTSKKSGLEPRALTPDEVKLFTERKWMKAILIEEEVKILENAAFSPTNTCLDGGEFLALLVRAELATNEQIRELFENPPQNFNIINWQALRWNRWPSIKGQGEGLAQLARLLGKKGVQRYAWDGGYGDVSASWRTVFIPDEGELFWEGTQTYGGMNA